MKTVVHYIGVNNSFFNKIIKYLNDNCGQLSEFEGSSFNCNDFNIEEVILSNPNVILFDLIPAYEFKLKKLKDDLVRYYYPKVIPFIGLNSDLTEIPDTFNRILPNFAYNSISENSSYDEAFFIAKTIVQTSIPNYPITNEFAIAKPNEEIIGEFPTYLRELSLKHLLIETTFNLNSNRLSINNKLIKNIINFDSDNLVYKGSNYNTLLLPNKFSQVFNINLITPNEKEIIKEDTKKTLEANKVEGNDYSKKLIKLINEQKNSLILEKQSKYINWLKKNINLFKKSYRKTEVIIFSKEFTNIKLMPKLAELINITVLKNVSIDIVDRIKIISPHYILWDLEDIYIDCETEEDRDKIKDIVFKDNYVKSLQYLIKELDINYFDKNHLDVFLPSSADFVSITNNIPKKDNINFHLNKLSKEFSNDFLITKTNDNKKLLIPVSLDQMNKVAELSPLDSYSTLEIKMPVILEFISESEGVLKSKSELPFYTPIKINYNELEFTITLIPNSKLTLENSKKEYKRYHGFINNVSEDTRQKIRSYVIKHENQNTKMA